MSRSEQLNLDEHLTTPEQRGEETPLALDGPNSGAHNEAIAPAKGDDFAVVETLGQSTVNQNVHQGSDQNEDEEPSDIQKIRMRKRAETAKFVDEANDSELALGLAWAQVDNNSLLENKLTDVLERRIPEIAQENEAEEDEVIKILNDTHAHYLEKYGASKGDALTTDLHQANTKVAKDIAISSLNDEDGQELLHEMGRALETYTVLLAGHEQKMFSRKKNRNKLEQARLNYEKLRGQVNDTMLSALKDSGIDQDAVQKEMINQDVGRKAEGRKGELGNVQDRTAAEAERIGRESKFVSWWTRQNGVKGAMKKAGVLAPVGIVLGAAAGPVVGAVAAGFFSNRIAKGYMTATINNRSKTYTNAREEARLRRSDQVDKIDAHTEKADPNEIWTAQEVTSQFTEGAELNIYNNRKRMFGTMAVTAAFGALGAVAGDLIGSRIGSKSFDRPKVSPFGATGAAGVDIYQDDSAASKNLSTQDTRPARSVAIEQATSSEGDVRSDPGSSVVEAPAPGYEARTLNVKQGEGFTQVFDRLATNRGYSLSPDQLYDIYNQMSGLDGMDGTYRMPSGDLGISGSEIELSAEQQEEFEKLLKKYKR